VCSISVSRFPTAFAFGSGFFQDSHACDPRRAPAAGAIESLMNYLAFASASSADSLDSDASISELDATNGNSELFPNESREFFDFHSAAT